MMLHARDTQPQNPAKTRKLVLMVTHGPEHPEAATIPFAMAVAAQAGGVEVVLGFQMEGVRLLISGVAEQVAVSGYVPLKELMNIYRENGGTLIACGPCVNTRKINPEDFIDGAHVENAPLFIEQFITATNVLVY
jgi:predicted peroxiredoxin